MARAVESGREKAQKTGHRLTLHVRIFRKGTFWYAECVTLSLITRRSDQDEALKALLEQVMLYLHDAWESGQWEQMVPRPASWRRWFWYYLDDVIDFARRITGRSIDGTTYKIPTDPRGNLVGVCA